MDVLIDLRDAAARSRVSLRCLRQSWDLLDFNVRGDAAPRESPVLQGLLSTVVPLPATAVSATRVFEFDGNHRINGHEFDMHRIDLSVPFGAVERWRFRAISSGPHPVHVHGTQFQVETRSGGRARVFPWERGWKDTVLVDDGETVDVLVRFDAYHGLYLLHCHRLEHEDGGMMLNFVVV
jgi:FtsP/CotA-like multicopper oxidase with cupredoxin domain